MSATTLEHIASGGNRHSSAADWAPSLLAFGTGNNIALWNPENASQRGISALLAGHTDTVNCVKIVDHGGQRILISGAADKTIRLWSTSENASSGFTETLCLTAHTHSVNALAVLPSCSMFVSASADATVKVWQFEGTTAKLIQSISLQPRYLPLALALTSLSNGDIVLAVAGTSTIIQMYVRTQSSAGFELQATLSGHEGWIRSLDFTRESSADDSDVLLASASQDRYIRLWRLHKGHAETSTSAHVADELASTAGKKSLTNKAHEVGSIGSKNSVTFEALLIGHEDWIYSARWKPSVDRTSTPVLLSASADNSLAIWQADAASGLWICTSRLGEISSQKGSTTATGSTGGFWIGLWQPAGESVASLGRTGSWRLWTHDSGNDMWLQQVGISGHVQEVRGLAWSPAGDYLLSTSSDQTTRLLAEWRRDDKSSWHEVSRPQIHGYDLNCVDTISEDQFISGADEKLLRVFNKPKAVDHLVLKLRGLTISHSSDLPEVANIPVLGLSNKAEAAADAEQPNGHANGTTNGDVDKHQGINQALPTHTSPFDPERPTLEDHLARHTLWPEHEKLYGHGYEISAVATSNDRSLVATACKASSIDHAVIRLYDTKEWREVKPALTAHSLTVTSIKFSSDDTYMLSVGRDRQWAVFKREANGSSVYEAFCSDPKGHSRMILDCSWAPAPAGNVFATAGRDKTVKIWKLVENRADCIGTISTNSPVTAVALSPYIEKQVVTLAYGQDDGRIGLVKLRRDTFEIIEREDLDACLTHCKTVNALRWRPICDPMGRHQLASASDDTSVRIYNIF